MNKEILESGVLGLKSNPTLLDTFFKEYERVTGEKPCAGCPGKLDDYYQTYLNYSDMNEIVFKLKNPLGFTWSLNGGAMDVTDANVNRPLKASNGREYPLGAHIFAVSGAYMKLFSQVPANLSTMVAEIRGKASNEVSFADRLEAIKGLGKKSAEKVAQDFSNEDAIREHIAQGKELPYRVMINRVLINHFA